MNVLDAVLVVAGLTFAVSGYRQGFLVGVLSFIGFVVGGIAGMIVAPRVVEDWDPRLAGSGVAVILVLVTAAASHLLVSWLAGGVRDRIRWRPGRYLDSALGAVVSVTAMLLVTHVATTALGQAPLPTVSRQIRGSAVLTTVEQFVPAQTRGAFGSFRKLLDENAFPRVFAELAPQRIVPVAPPTEGIARGPVVQRVRASVVKVASDAEACDRHIEGSGFVFAPERVMTNAHVVAGVDEASVQPGGQGRSYPATVVHYDPRLDVAVLYVPGLDVAPLRFERGAERGDEGIVIGYPRGGPYAAVPARVREQLDAKGPDIYGDERVNRRVLSLFSEVRPGNSGGPLVSAKGTVRGVIFAKSVDDQNTGYALTVAEVSRAAADGAVRVDEVDTGNCPET